MNMKSGDIKKAAGIEVYLLRTDDFDTFLAKIKQIDSEYAESIGERRRLLEIENESENIWLELYKQKSSDERNSRDLKRLEDNHSMVKDASDRLHALIDERNGKMKTLLSSALVKKTQTDVNGHFKFSTISRGIYMVFASHKVFDKDVNWLTRINVGGGENKVDLTNNNMLATVVLF